MYKKLFNALLLVLVSLLGVFYSGCATASIMITPTLVVFDGRERYADVTLVNNGQSAQSYKISWSYQAVDPKTGSYTIVEAPVEGAFDLGKHIVFSPRQVRLESWGKQKIRLALRRPAEIEQGDYYAYLKFEAMPENIIQDGSEVGDGQGVGAGVQINVSYAIPVVFRAGESPVSAKIGKISLNRNPDNGLLDAVVPITRPEGSYGVLGHLWVYYMDGGKEELVGEVSNANIFPDIDEKTFNVSLKKDIKGGSLKVMLRYFDKNNDYIYDEKMFTLE